MTLELKKPSDFPTDDFRTLLKLQAEFQQAVMKSLKDASRDKREFLQRYLGCSDEVQSVVRSMFAVLESQDVTEVDRKRAINTIADSLFLNPIDGHGSYGYDLERVERDAADSHPDSRRRPVIGKRLDQLDSQEAAFAQRLRETLKQKNIKQEELAKRLGCSQSAISKMLNRQSRPQRNTILKMATALDVSPTDLWPDLEVAVILDTIAEFAEEGELTEAQAAAIDAAEKRPPAKIKGKRLPSRKDRKRK